MKKSSQPVKGPKVSRFGSHKSMMVADHILEDTVLGVDRILGGEVLLKDEEGYYVTHRSRLDNGLADPKRYSSTVARAECV